MSSVLNKGDKVDVDPTLVDHTSLHRIMCVMYQCIGPMFMQVGLLLFVMMKMHIIVNGQRASLISWLCCISFLSDDWCVKNINFD